MVEIFVAIGIVFIALMCILVFYVPTNPKRKKKKPKSQNNEKSEELISWERKVSRLEKHIQSLNNVILDHQNRDKENEKLMMVERVKVKKLQEKLSQERRWHEKEQGGIDKKVKEYKELKADLRDAQENFSKEHSANLRHVQKIKELEQDNSKLIEMRRKVESANSELITKVDNNRKEIAGLKKDNIQLKKKSDDVNWIAKTEYDRVTNLLKEKEKQLKQVNRENKK